MEKQYDEEGRVCSRCREWIPWKDDGGRWNFYANKSGPHGRKTTCKACDRWAKRRRAPSIHETCARCGDEKVADTRAICQYCRERSRKWSKAIMYLVIDGGGDFERMARFTKYEFELSLKDGIWPEGMIVESWKGKRYVGTYRIRGEELEEIAARPVGDGYNLVP